MSEIESSKSCSRKVQQTGRGKQQGRSIPATRETHSARARTATKAIPKVKVLMEEECRAVDSELCVAGFGCGPKGTRTELLAAVVPFQNRPVTTPCSASTVLAS
eukprot:3931843-Rhodomonas_salina.6